MATTFPVSTYPLNDRTRITGAKPVKRDIMDDGTPRFRSLGDGNYRMLRIVFNPLTEQEMQDLLDYLNTNKATEFDVAMPFGSPIQNYTGYFWNEPNVSTYQGSAKDFTVSVDFYGSVA